MNARGTLVSALLDAPEAGSSMVMVGLVNACCPLVACVVIWSSSVAGSSALDERFDLDTPERGCAPVHVEPERRPGLEILSGELGGLEVISPALRPVEVFAGD